MAVFEPMELGKSCVAFREKKISPFNMLCSERTAVINCFSCRIQHLSFNRALAVRSGQGMRDVTPETAKEGGNPFLCFPCRKLNSARSGRQLGKLRSQD